MKIAALLGHQPACFGGGFTYQETIIKELLHYDGQHEFYIFYHKAYPAPTTQNQKITFISVDENPAAENNLSFLLLRYHIDLCLFLSCQFQFVHTPFICTVWDVEHRKNPFFPEVSQTGWTWEAREASYRQLLPKATFVITGTAAGQQEIHDYYQVPKEHIKIMPFTIPDWITEFENQILEAPVIPSGEPYLFYPAQFWPHKNHIVLLHALKILRETYSHPFSLVFTGSDMGNLQHIQAEAKRLDLENHIIFKGFVERKTLAALYKHAFALVFPTFFGPDNLPPLEAFGLGCPVLVATHYESHKHLGDAVLLFNPTNENEIAHHIHTLVLNPNQRNQLIDNGFAFYRKNSTTKFINAVEPLFNELELYRRTWSRHMLYRHFNPDSQQSEHNVQNTIDDIYAAYAAQEQLKIKAQRYEAEIQQLSQELSQVCEAKNQEIQRLQWVIRRTTLIGILRSLWNRLKRYTRKQPT